MSTAVEQDPNLEAEHLSRDVGILGLLWASEGSIIGSGWLFGPLGALAVAGPSAIIGWVIASVIIMVLALVHAELGGLEVDRAERDPALRCTVPDERGRYTGVEGVDGEQ